MEVEGSLMNATRTILLVLGAAAAGAGIALLFAPQSGERTRRQIRHKTEDLVNDFREDLEVKAHEAYEQGASAVDDLGRRFRALKPKLAAIVPR